MILYSTFICLLSVALTVQALPVSMGINAVGLAKRMESSGELIGGPSPLSTSTQEICKVIHEGKEVPIMGHLAKGGTQKQAWVVTSAPGFPTNMHYFAKTHLTKTEFEATREMGLIVAHNAKEDCAMMHFLGKDITSLESYKVAYAKGVKECEEWVDQKFNLVEVQIEGMRGVLGEFARHRDLHPLNTRWMSETLVKIIDYGMLHRDGGRNAATDVDKAMRAVWKQMLCKGAGHGATPPKDILSGSGISDGDYIHVNLSASTSSFEVLSHSQIHHDSHHPTQHQ